MTPKVPDIGHREADKELYALIRRLNISYRLARINLQEKIDAYLEQFEKDDALYRALYDSGEMSHEEFLKWRQKKIVDTRAWRDMLDQLADDMTHQNQIAASMINDSLPDVYALNHNYGTFEVEKGSGYDTTYTMYDKFTVRRLLQEGELQLPQPSVNIPKDELWNRQHMQSAILQGVLTGEPIKDIAKRMIDVTGMSESSAIRNARTSVTGAENAGRIDSYVRAEKMGIKMKQMWLATLDGRTRDSHAILDGEQQEVGKTFSNGCRYPGDPKGAPAEIWNCRCSLVAVVEGADPYNPNLRKSQYLEDQGLTYEQWKEMHGERYYSKLFNEEYLSLNDTMRNLQGTEDSNSEAVKREQKSENKAEVKRPDNEPSYLRDFRYVGVPEDGTDIYKTVNPNFGKGVEYSNNCVRCIGTEEMNWRGYDVEAMPHNDNDPVKKDGSSFWNIDLANYDKDPYGFENFGTPDKVISVVRDAFVRWGDGSRAMMAFKWKDDTSHAIFVRRDGGKIIFENTQSGMIWNVLSVIDQMSPEENTSFLMRIDNRPFNENVKYIAKNREQK